MGILIDSSHGSKERVAVRQRLAPRRGSQGAFTTTASAFTGSERASVRKGRRESAVPVSAEYSVLTAPGACLMADLIQNG